MIKIKRSRQSRNQFNRKRMHSFYIILFVFILLITSTAGAAAASDPDNQLININFKGVDLRDVFRTIAELAGVNLVTDGSVAGSLTLNLRDITFEEALNLITRTQQLAYKWDGNTVVVASPERLEEIYTRIITSTIKIEHADPVQVKGIINGIYPGLNIQIDSRNSYLIVKGKEEEIKEAANLIEKIDLPRDTETRTIRLQYAGPGKTAELVRAIYPSLKVEQDEAGGQLIVYGSVEAIEAAVKLVREIDIAPEKEEETGVEDPGQASAVQGRESSAEEAEEAAGVDGLKQVAGGEQEPAADQKPTAGQEMEQDKINKLPGDQNLPEGEMISEADLSADKGAGAAGEEQAAAGELEVEEEILKTIRLQYADPESVRGQINGLFPGINVQVDRMNNQLILLGSEEMIRRVEELVALVDLRPERVSKTEEVALEYSDPLKIRKQLLVKFPELEIKTSGERGLVFTGRAEDVNQALKLVVEEDQPEEVKEARQVTEAVRIVNTELEVVREQLNKIMPELNIVTDPLSRELLLTGEVKQVRSAVLTARKIDSLNREVTEFVQIDYLNLGRAGEILSGLYPGIKLQLNEEKRQLIISGRVTEVDKALNTAKKLNVPRRQVIIEARVEEIKVNQLKNLGLYPDKLTGIRFIKNEGGGIDSLAVNWPEAIKALEEEGLSNTLANPRLMTLNGEQAKLLIGDRIPVVVDSGEEGQQIQYIDAGITLQFTPWIGDDDQITLDVSPKVSSIGESIGSGIPPVNTREAQTKIRLKDGQTFAIGGLIQDTRLNSSSQVPLLAEIPIIGELFKRVDNKDIKTELIIFITPHIVKDNGAAGDEALRKDISIGNHAPDRSGQIDNEREGQPTDGDTAEGLTDRKTVGGTHNTGSINNVDASRDVDANSDASGDADSSHDAEGETDNKSDAEADSRDEFSVDDVEIEMNQVVGLTIEEIEEILNREF